MSWIEVSLHPPRLTVWRRHIHHFWTGVGLVAAGVAVIASDWDDRCVWLHDLIWPERPEVGWPEARITTTDHRRRGY